MQEDKHTVGSATPGQVLPICMRKVAECDPETQARKQIPPQLLQEFLPPSSCREFLP